MWKSLKTGFIIINRNYSNVYHIEQTFLEAIETTWTLKDGTASRVQVVLSNISNTTAQTFYPDVH
jgi:hypothetical protein